MTKVDHEHEPCKTVKTYFEKMRIEEFPVLNSAESV
jgi:hypothetical protein